MINQNGFTLIETIIYLSLFSIIIGGGMAAAYQIIQSTDNTQNHVVLQGEANFIFRKIDWALTGLDGPSSISTPSADNPYSDENLIVTKNIAENPTQITLALSNGNLTLQRGSSGIALPLNSSSVTVSITPSVNLFQRIIAEGKPDAITTSFTLATAQNGRPASQNFSITKYLRK